MTFLRTIGGLIAGALLASALVGCTQASDDSARGYETAEQPILGGQLATGEKYRAVGALVQGFDYPGYGVIVYTAFCSGTLVGPDKVLTARHCTPSIDQAPSFGLAAYFAVGDNPYFAEQYIPITDYVTAAPSPSPTKGLLLDGGRDIAMVSLETQPEAVVPAKIGQFERSMLGSRFEIAGYGYSGDAFGSRYAGLSTARALEGHWYSLIFNRDRNAFLEWYFTDAPTNPSMAEANLWWSIYKLEPTYELLMGGLEGDAIGCFGDSGGPMMLGDAADDLTVYGVGFATEASISQVCALGNAFVPFFNQDIRDFVADALGE